MTEVLEQISYTGIAPDVVEASEVVYMACASGGRDEIGPEASTSLVINFAPLPSSTSKATSLLTWTLTHYVLI